MPVANQLRESMKRSSWIREMFEEGARLKAIHGEDQVHDFSLGNPILEPPQQVHRQLQEILTNPTPGMHRYMPNAGFDRTRAYVAEELNKETGLNFQAQDMVMCVGAGGGLNVVMKALLDPGDEVLTPSPFFVEYGAYASNHGGVLKTVKTTDAFQLDLEAFDAALNPKTKIVIINTPNNPTGVIYPQQSLDELGVLIREKEKEFGHPIILVADDIYRRLVFDGLTSGDVLLSHPHSIRVHSHSKDLGLPGERIGFIAVHPGIPERETICQGLVLANRILGFVNAPALMQQILPSMGQATVDVSIYQKLRDRFYEMLTGLGFEVVLPQGAFYLFPKSPEADDVAFVRRAQQERILLVPGSGFGGPGHFRISICCSEEDIERSRPGFEKLAAHYGLRK